MSIRELLIIQSVYMCETRNDIIKLVDIQGDPGIFYQSFLELDRRNMVSILAFDSYIIRSLLDEAYSQHFTSEIPIFYKNKSDTIGKKKYINAIDVAL